MQKSLFLILVTFVVLVSGCISEEPQYQSFSDGTLNFTYPASWETFQPENAQSAFKSEEGISKDVLLYVGNNSSELAVARVTATEGYYLQDVETVKNQFANEEDVLSAEIITLDGRRAAKIRGSGSTMDTTLVYLKLSRTSGYAFMYNGPKGYDPTLDEILQSVRIT